MLTDDQKIALENEFGSESIIHVSDLCERYEDLEREFDGIKSDLVERGLPCTDEEMSKHPGFEQESWDLFKAIDDLLEDLRGAGGNHKWQGNWYPDRLIADGDIFVQEMQELCESIGDVSKSASYIVIDWEATARNLQQDYSSVTVGLSEFWYR
jgi:hypothetical protein